MILFLFKLLLILLLILLIIIFGLYAVYGVEIFNYINTIKNTKSPKTELSEIDIEPPKTEPIIKPIKLLYPRIGRMPDKEPCDPGQRDDGISCWGGHMNIEIKKTLFNRQTCRADEDKHAMLCYPKCKPDYKAVGLLCEPN